jgi:multiple sugar transport system permease protein
MVRSKSFWAYGKEFIRIILCLVFALMILIPIIWVVCSSFRPTKDFLTKSPTLFPPSWTLDHYTALFLRLNVLKYIYNSVVYAFVKTVGNVFFCSMAGYAFGRIAFKGKNVLFTMCLATMMIPFQIILVPSYLILNYLGWLDTYAGLIIPGLASVFGVFLLRGFFLTLPKDLEEAARVDGLNEFGIFFRIMLPLCVPIIVTLSVFTVNGCWNDLLWPLLVTSNESMRTLTIGIVSFVGLNSTNYGPAMAGAVISMLPIFILFIFGQKYFVESIATTGIKG